MKLRLLAAAMAVLAVGPALAQSAPAAPAPAAASTATDKSTLSYAIGYDMARDLAERKVDLDMAKLMAGINDGYAKKEPAMPGEKLAAALSSFQKRMADQEKANFERVVRENKAKSDAFMAANKSKPGVVSLPSGVQYRIIEPGTGPKPTANSTVQAHLRGSISTGQEFANTYSTQNAKPAEFKVSEFPLDGVKEVIQMMPVGSRWEIYIPANKAYGDNPRSPIGPAQAVVFDVKLISSK
jgi:peptidylprolyl isomerase